MRRTPQGSWSTRFGARVVASSAAFLGCVALAGACDSSLNLGDGAIDGASSTDASAAPRCSDVCDRLIACGLGDVTKRDQCLSQCASSSRPSDLACIMGAACQDIYGACIAPLVGDSGVFDPLDAAGGFEEQSEIDECNSACDRFHFFDCIDAAGLTRCRGLCQTAERATRSTFNSCSSGAGSSCEKVVDCLTVFGD